MITTFCTAQNLNFAPTNSTGQIINHTYYSLSYVEEHEQAEWVFYELTKQDILGTTKRVDSYRPDPKVSTGSSERFDFKGSGYDRGHLAPAGDMKRSFEAMSESFFYSNMSPQLASFNQGIWNQLEIRVRNWVKQKNHMYIATGPIFIGNIEKIGFNKVTVPGFYYKALLTLVEDKYQCIAFILPNQLGTSELSQYAVSIDDLETLTNIDFWSTLPDSIENQIESEVIIDDWFSKKELQKNKVIETPPLSTENRPLHTLNTLEAQKYIDEEVTVCGCIVSTNYIERASATYLNLDRKYPNHYFTLTIWGDKRKNFNGKPEENYFGKKVCVHGKIKLIKGIPSINLNSESDLNMLD